MFTLAATVLAVAFLASIAAQVAAEVMSTRAYN